MRPRQLGSPGPWRRVCLATVLLVLCAVDLRHAGALALKSDADLTAELMDSAEGPLDGSVSPFDQVDALDEDDVMNTLNPYSGVGAAGKSGNGGGLAPIFHKPDPRTDWMSDIKGAIGTNGDDGDNETDNAVLRKLEAPASITANAVGESIVPATDTNGDHEGNTHHNGRKGKEYLDKKNWGDEVEEGVDEAGGAVEDAADTVASGVEDAADTVAEGATSAVDTVAAASEEAGDAVAQHATEAADATASATTDAAAALESGVDTAGSEVTGAVGEAGDAMHGAAMDTADAFTPGGGGGDDYGGDGGGMAPPPPDPEADDKATVDGALAKSSSTQDKVDGALDDLGHRTRSDVRKANSKLGQEENKIADGLEQNNSKVSSEVNSELSGADDAVTSTLGEGAQDLKDTEADAAAGVSDAASKIEAADTETKEIADGETSALAEVNTDGTELDDNNKGNATDLNDVGDTVEEEEKKIETIAGQGDGLSERQEANEQHIEEMQSDLKDLISTLAENDDIRRLKTYGSSQEDSAFEKLVMSRHGKGGPGAAGEVDAHTQALRNAQKVMYPSGRLPDGTLPPYIPSQAEETQWTLQQVVYDPALPAPSEKVLVDRPGAEPVTALDQELVACRRQLEDTRQALATDRANFEASDPDTKAQFQSIYVYTKRKYNQVLAIYNIRAAEKAKGSTVPSTLPAYLTTPIPGAPPPLSLKGGPPPDYPKEDPSDPPSTPETSGDKSVFDKDSEKKDTTEGSEPMEEGGDMELKEAITELDESEAPHPHIHRKPGPKVINKPSIKKAQRIMTASVIAAIRKEMGIPKHARFNKALHHVISETVVRMLHTRAMQETLGVDQPSFLGSLNVPGSGVFDVMVGKDHKATLVPAVSALRNRAPQTNGGDGLSESDEKAHQRRDTVLARMKAKLARNRAKLEAEREREKWFSGALYNAMDVMSDEMINNMMAASAQQMQQQQQQQLQPQLPTPQQGILHPAGLAASPYGRVAFYSRAPPIQVNPRYARVAAGANGYAAPMFQPAPLGWAQAMPPVAMVPNMAPDNRMVEPMDMGNARTSNTPRYGAPSWTPYSAQFTRRVKGAEFRRRERRNPGPERMPPRSHRRRNVPRRGGGRRPRRMLRRRHQHGARGE